MTITKKLYLVLVYFFSCSTLFVSAQNTKLSGHLTGLSGDTVTIFYNKDEVSRLDTVIAKGDDFSWSVDLQEPVRVALTAGRTHYFFFAQPGEMKLTGTKDSLSTYQLSGASMQQDAEEFSSFMQELTEERDLLFAQLQKATVDQKIEIQKQRRDLDTRASDRIAQFIAGHPNSLYSIYLVSVERDYPVIKRLYGELGDSAKATSGGARLARRLTVMEKNQVGVEVADFTQTDIQGKKISFRNFKGKYVLLDFWASWCMPCRAENPNVRAAYEAYRSRGFTVIGISLDDKAASWKKAVRDDKMPWTQLSDLKGFKNELAVRFGVEAIPINFLIDPSGKVVARDLRGEALQNKLKELLN